MQPVLKSLSALAIAFLILIQKDERGDLLINGHIALAAVCIALMLYAIGVVSYELGKAES
jgi:hypothetical protein